MGNCHWSHCCKPENQKPFGLIDQKTSSSFSYGKARGSPLVDFSFTSEELERIRKSWNRAKTREVGLDIIVSMIRKKPRYAECLGVSIQDQESDRDIRQQPVIILQGHRIQDLLDTIVCCLGQLPMAHLRQLCFRIGSIHYYRGVNFSADNWLIFKRIMIEQILHKQPPPSPKLSLPGKLSLLLCENHSAHSMSLVPYSTNYCQAQGFAEETAPLVSEEKEQIIMGIHEAVWNKVLTLIIQEMKRGFLEEALKNCTH